LSPSLSAYGFSLQQYYTQSIDTKGKIIYMELYQLKSFCVAKKTNRKKKATYSTGEDYFQTLYFIRGYFLKQMKTSYNK
jgi:hypothetical protein